MPVFTGSLKANEVFASLYNQIISIQVFDTGIGFDQELYDAKKVDGTLYGDTKLYISTDVLKSYSWTHEVNVGYNLLTQKRPPAPVEQSVSINVFRQIPITVDDYLTKRAFEKEGSFVMLNGVLLSWLGKTKEVYEHTTYLASILVTAKTKGIAFKSITLTAPAGVAGYELIKWRAQELFRQIDDIGKELKEPSREYNDVEFLRNYKLEDFDIVVPLGLMSNVDKHAIPFLFNEDSKQSVKEVHWKYFGTKITIDTASALGTERSLIETDYGSVHVFPGDLIPITSVVAKNTAYAPDYAAKPSIQNNAELFLIHKADFPIMSAFTVGTSFFNGQTLTTNQYLTFGHNDLEDAHIGEFPLLKLKIVIA